MELSTEPLFASKQASQASPSLNEMCRSGNLFRDRYKIMKALGRGGFGVTFLARDAQLPGNPVCVIKQLCPKVSNPTTFERACERFEREAKTLSQLGSHAQIPRLLDYFQQEGEFYLVQEYVHGCTLAKEVRQNGPASEYKVKQFLVEILPVLEFIHSQQVIHRDIKPPNIIRCQDDGRLVLIDFGAVKERIAELENTTQKGHTTQFVGTIGFAPPEQLALRPTYASDLYAIGVTCLFMLTGRPPMEFEYDPITGELCWENDVAVSDHFGKILSKLLKVSVRERYQSVGEVMRALELEPYLDNLADCMNKPRRPLVVPEPIATLEPPVPIGRSPFSKTADQIRGWRKRLQQRQDRQQWNGELMSSGYL
ncbi:protein kinase domain-containing protein [Leptolyngbya sp. AN02str]|uniref:protein kinase domain-containing protein n=1 Tax=Leptolyngbya sp. AN02str TaxID=3423363 RepID=UPI003D313C13